LLRQDIISADEDDDEFFLSTGRDCFESTEGTNESSKSDQEMLAEVDARKCVALKK
jgi:hypothetical protein